MTTFDIASLSRTGGRKANEDYADFLQTDASSCWVLADGLGGHRGGATASKTVVEAALASFRERPEVSAEAIDQHVTRAQDALLAAQTADPSLSQMRSTIVVLVSTDREAVWGHVGDSRLYHVRGGQIASRTRDHSVSQALVDGGQIDAHDQGAHEDRSRLLRCLGKEGEIGATIGEPQSLCRGDAFLLCTDGFWESIDEIEIELDFAGSQDGSAWLDRMEARLRRSRVGASTNGTKDNYTATAIRLLNEAAPPAPPHDPRRAPVANERHHEAFADGWPVLGSGSAPTAARARWWMAGAAAAVLIVLMGAGVWQRDRIRTWIQTWWTSAPAKDDKGAAPDKTGPQNGGQDQPAPDQPPSPPPNGSASGKGRNEAKPEGTPKQGVPDTSTPGHESKPPKPSQDPPEASDGAAQEPAGTSAAPAALMSPATRAFASPAEMPAQTVFRPAKGLSYSSLQDAIVRAEAGETIWIGPGQFSEALAPITKALTLKGAGRDATRIDLANHHGLVMRGASGGIEDVDLCCASGDAVLTIDGSFRGTIARTRVRIGQGWGIVINGAAAAEMVDVTFEGTGKGTVSVRPSATAARAKP